MKNTYGWFLTTFSLYALNFAKLNDVLTLTISFLSIIWLAIKIINALKGKNDSN
jgi:hypothetical protein